MGDDYSQLLTVTRPLRTIDRTHSTHDETKLPKKPWRACMTREELFSVLARWIADICESEPPVLEEQTDLAADLGLDSLALAELAAKLRFKFKIKLRPGEIQHELRVGPLADLVLQKLRDKER